MDSANGSWQKTEVHGTHQGRNSDDASERDRQFRPDGGGNGAQWPLRTNHQNWFRADSPFWVAVNGGILAQLIAETQHQLGSVQECIACYEKQKEELQQRLERLQRLQNSQIG